MMADVKLGSFISGNALRLLGGLPYFSELTEDRVSNILFLLANDPR